MNITCHQPRGACSHCIDVVAANLAGTPLTQLTPTEAATWRRTAVDEITWTKP